MTGYSRVCDCICPKIVLKPWASFASLLKPSVELKSGIFELRNSRWMFFGLACLEINYTLRALTFLAKVIDRTEPSRSDDNDNINYKVPVKATQ